MIIGFYAHHYTTLEDFAIGLQFAELVKWREAKAAGDGPAVPPLAQAAEGGTVLRDLIPRPLRPLSTFVGRNSTGKTAVFEALDFLSDCARYDLPFAASTKQREGFSELRTYGCKEEMILSVTCLLPQKSEILNWVLTIHADAYNRPFILHEEVNGIFCTQEVLEGIGYGAYAAALVLPQEGYSGVRQYLNLTEGRGSVRGQAGEEAAGLTDPRWSGLSVYGSLLHYPVLKHLLRYIRRWYYCRIGGSSLPGKLASAVQLNAGGAHRHLNEYGSNVRNVLKYLKTGTPDNYRRIMSRIQQYLPGKSRFSLKELEQDPPKGEPKLFLLLLLLEDADPKPLILLDNPDAGLHHEMVNSLSLALRDYTVRHPLTVQLLLSSHSTTLLDLMAPDEVWNFYKARDADTERIGSQAACVAESAVVRAMYAEGIGLGSLWYSGHFDSIPDGSAAEESDDGNLLSDELWLNGE
jgi:predicted ATPase